MKRMIAITVEVASERHCHNDCPYMEHSVLGYCCILFGNRLGLLWDTTRFKNGYSRTEACCKGQSKMKRRTQ
uniref:Uncharacterized protein n=1 Tax=viral metagenome TaxID=1070528 RepID=A0A6M3XX46_9ZZZZ